MAEGIWNNIITWAILILFVVLFIFIFYSPAEGFMGKISKLALGVQRWLPFAPQEELKKDEYLPQATIDVQKAFMNDISMYRDKGNCLLPINDISGLERYKMEISNYQGIMSRIEKPAGEGIIKLSPIEINDKELHVCIIEPKAFYDCYLNPAKKDCTKQIYKSTDIVEITKDDILIDGENYDLLNTFMFKPDKDNVCFIPLRSGFLTACSADKYSLDKDCISEINLKIKNCAGLVNNLQLCQIMYECADSEYIQTSLKEFCTEDNPAIRTYTEEDCNRVRNCAVKKAKEFKIKEPNICFKQLPGPVYILSFANQR